MLMDWFKCCRCTASSTVLQVLSKMYELRRNVQVLFLKKLLIKKQHVYRNKKLSILYYYSLMKLYKHINYSYSEIILEVKLKVLVFFFVQLTMWKVEKVESINVESDSNKEKENGMILCIYRQWKSTKRWRALIHRMIRK